MTVHYYNKFHNFIIRKAIDGKHRMVLCSIDKDDPCLVFLPSAETLLESDQRGWYNYLYMLFFFFTTICTVAVINYF